MRCNRILIVEDDENIRTILGEVLEVEGYIVCQASNGKEALEILDKIDNDTCLILLDLMMPIMDGWEFLELRNRNVNLASIPIMVMSAVVDKIEVKPSVNRVIKKPFDLEKILAIVKLYCGSICLLLNL